MKIENEEIEIVGDDLWINGELITNYGAEEWFVFLDNNIQKEFETLEEAVKCCLEESHD
ncbi:hypothetical protein [Acinetobacter dispersus]|uniref:Uncharacterized protein n=1 Tax=Acinetobacter dispersus TaxID=70348 RepID=N9MHM6_9GAMM|nr:hypothetical protein [Acinetobacter dispersus]ENW92795.1 hypothetical protein F904_02738 [Acinetobacter dispersus]